MQHGETVVARAPGKVILSGEHAVIYGAPAIVLAVDLFLEASLQLRTDQQNSFHFMEGGEIFFSYAEAEHQAFLLKENYARFLKGELSLSTLLREPSQLGVYIIGELYHKFKPAFDYGTMIKIKSNFPIGHGMGASAAFITSLVRVLVGLLELPFVAEEWLVFCKQAENLQHGHSSGIDIRASLFGGSFIFQRGKFQSFDYRFPICLVDTGKPVVSTGETIMAVAEKVKKLWRSFAEVTEQLGANNSPATFYPLIAENHRLLTKIGVVPKRVDNFIQEVERLGNVAKISGAGASQGEQGGIVLIFGPRNVQELVDKYGYTMIMTRVSDVGVHLSN